MLKRTLSFMLAGCLALPGLSSAADAAASGAPASAASSVPAASAAPAAVRAADATLVERGRYLAVAGDCMACHTAKGGKPFAGGLPMRAPLLGTIYTTNITPDKETGIGDWSFADFERAVRHGVAKNGDNLYPAMPYVSYTKVTDDDVKALYAYFMHGVEPVRQPPRRNDIPWYLSMRWPLKIWNLLFLKEGVYQPKPERGVEWNRGAYLVQGLAHCGTCHTPRAVTLQEKSLDETGGSFLAGSVLSGWDGYNITSDPNAGIGGWSQPQLVQYLRTGSVPGLAQAAGPMAEAVEHSFSRMSNADIGAIATYVRTVPAVADGAAKARSAWGKPAEDGIRLRGVALASTGIDPARLYLGNCASCHQMQGKGTPDGYYPQLFHNSTVGAPNPTNLVQVILNGVARKAGGEDVGMPAFRHELSDAQIAALANYLTVQFGNPAAKVSEQDVAKLRAAQ
ncbi:cytochrome c family protein [Burkholderia pseudomallei]|uniref:Cytochrome c n=1 Tax=Burkholderia pseudomallei TaxID=28450 RepID=A0A8A4E7J2_BURPE|nr:MULTISPECIES: cytochrome c [Burkholderia]AJW55938.1 cytochrome C [Burkholderia pseudomallei]AJX40921.1 cytochrome c family protein [Burkholderia pseudomallei]ANW54099.1 cytochrome C [Burkholderia pseudomallei]ANW60054.1 cytochrome C [Burkholderia pseudomallei]KGX64235.1 cytochrome c family protein [Burkholderia pseudomallei TSV44]